MRTKTLLIAAAALAAAVTTSQAQTVYSANVVGYVNTPFPVNGYSMVNNPLSGTTNGAEAILPGLTGGENVLVWSGHGYYIYTFQGVGGGSPPWQSDWTDGAASPPSAPAIPGDQTDTSDGVYWAPQPVIAPGQGFFVFNPNSSIETNTFTGTVVTTNTVSFPPNGYTMTASAIPVAGNAETNTVLNLTAGFQGGENVLVWSGHGYYIYTFQGVGGGSPPWQSDWTDGAASPPQAPGIPGDQTDTSDGVYWAPPLNLNVGQGFFVFNPNATADKWTQTITNIP
jgi:hypothetical protein